MFYIYFSHTLPNLPPPSHHHPPRVCVCEWINDISLFLKEIGGVGGGTKLLMLLENPLSPHQRVCVSVHVWCLYVCMCVCYYGSNCTVIHIDYIYTYEIVNKTKTTWIGNRTSWSYVSFVWAQHAWINQVFIYTFRFAYSCVYYIYMKLSLPYRTHFAVAKLNISWWNSGTWRAMQIVYICVYISFLIVTRNGKLGVLRTNISFLPMRLLKNNRFNASSRYS